METIPLSTKYTYSMALFGNSSCVRRGRETDFICSVSIARSPLGNEARRRLQNAWGPDFGTALPFAVSQSLVPRFLANDARPYSNNAVPALLLCAELRGLRRNSGFLTSDSGSAIGRLVLRFPLTHKSRHLVLLRVDSTHKHRHRRRCLSRWECPLASGMHRRWQLPTSAGRERRCSMHRNKGGVCLNVGKIDPNNSLARFS